MNCLLGILYLISTPSLLLQTSDNRASNLLLAAAADDDDDDDDDTTPWHCCRLLTRSVLHTSCPSYIFHSSG
jgi:hypothetical protein